MPTPILLPELGAGDEPIRVSLWLVDPGDAVEVGDRILEVLVRGMTFDVAAPAAGVLQRVTVDQDEVIAPSQILGWIDEVEPGRASTL